MITKHTFKQTALVTTGHSSSHRDTLDELTEAHGGPGTHTHTQRQTHTHTHTHLEDMGKGGKWGGWNGGQGQGLDPRNESQRRREAERRLPLRDELGVVRSELARSEQLGGQLLQRCEAAEA